MNKFSSLSTSVLLALLTSSFSAAAYADGNNTVSRISQRGSSDSADRLVMAGTTPSNRRLDDENVNEAQLLKLTQAGSNESTDTPDIQNQSTQGTPLELWDPNAQLNGDLPIVSINGGRATLLTHHYDHSSTGSTPSTNERSTPYSTEEALLLAEEEEEQLQEETPATAASSNATEPASTAPATSNAAVGSESALEASSLVQSQSAQAPDVGQSPLEMTYTQHSLQLQPEPAGSDAETSSAAGVQPTVMQVAFEHPSDLKESFIVAGSTSVLSYSNPQGNFAISFKLRALDQLELHSLTFQQFKDRLTARFHDKNNMLYGEYKLLHAYASAAEAREGNVIRELSVPENQSEKLKRLSVTNSDEYMDLSLRAFLKKGQDGILPDMQTFFYERDILTKGYLVTLSCEFRGSQAQASIVRHQFETFSPLCERILGSYSFAFLAPKTN